MNGVRDTLRVPTTRRGFSLAELMVALVIAGVVGVALTRLVVSQSRFIASEDGRMRARAVARAGLAVLSDELRQVAWGSVVALTKDSITVRAPYAWGIVCDQVSGATVAALLPPDSARYAQALNAGYAWRDTAGTWFFVEPATRTVTGGAPCALATPLIGAIQSPGGSHYIVALAPNAVATPDGGLVYLYQRVTYKFAPSTELPGRLGLWRNVVGGTGPEELVAPFDTSSRFEFLTGPMLNVTTTVPVLDSLRGLRLRLIAASENPPPGQTVPTKFPLISDIVFRNRER